jgi:CheY-like chemotaxis protein
VDDNDDNRDLLSRRLGRLGYSVSTAATGPEAIDVVRRRRIDLVLLDLMMPGMSGPEVFG